MAELNATLMVKEGDQLILNPSVEAEIINRSEAMKKAKAEYDSLIEGVQAVMEALGLVKLDTDRVLVNYIPEGTRETFQSKEFRKDYPQMYDDYCTISKVKAQVRVKVK